MRHAPGKALCLVALIMGAIGCGGFDSFEADASEEVRRGDLGKAEHARVQDEDVDQMNSALFRELLTYMIEEPRNVSRALRVTFIAKYLERIGDHATNIAQMVIFMCEGRDVRHPRARAATDGKTPSA